MTVLLVAGVVVAIAAAARSTWSPCGLSMLSTITPLGERGRGRRFGATAGWFVAGSVLGGLCLGACVATLAAGVGALHWSTRTSALVALGASLLAAASDAEVRVLRLPVHHRQVNERWLDQYRPWVYGMGFGWQIGAGLATYVMTAGVYLLVVLGSLAGEPLVALGLGALFGTVRGVAVLLGRRITDPGVLRAFHRRFAALGPTARWTIVGVELAAAVAMAALAWWPATLAVIVLTISVTTARVLPLQRGPVDGDVAPA